MTSELEQRGVADLSGLPLVHNASGPKTSKTPGRPLVGYVIALKNMKHFLATVAQLDYNQSKGYKSYRGLQMDLIPTQRGGIHIVSKVGPLKYSKKPYDGELVPTTLPAKAPKPTQKARTNKKRPPPKKGDTPADGKGKKKSTKARRPPPPYTGVNGNPQQNKGAPKKRRPKKNNGKRKIKPNESMA